MITDFADLRTFYHLSDRVPPVSCRQNGKLAAALLGGLARMMCGSGAGGGGAR
jgi:hypothetical protein